MSQGLSRRHIGLVASLFLAGCVGDPDCADGEVVEDGECVPEDTDVGDTDTDVEGPLSDDLSQVTLEWAIEQLPNDNLLQLFCNDRLIFEQGSFTARKSYSESFQIRPGDTCEVYIGDERGGLLAPGSLYSCSEEPTVWASRRSTGETVASIEVAPCVRGCVDPIAENFDPESNFDDGLCEYVLGCTDADALNFDPAATKDSGGCDFGGFGIVEFDVFSDNSPGDTNAYLRCGGFEIATETSFAANATKTLSGMADAGFMCEALIEDELGDRGAGGAVRVCGEEIVRVDFVDDPNPPAPPVVSYQPYITAVATFRMPVCSGCTDPLAPEYDEMALVDDGSCSVSDF